VYANLRFACLYEVEGRYPNATGKCLDVKALVCVEAFEVGGVEADKFAIQYP
jgi:hypothetical protein